MKKCIECHKDLTEKAKRRNYCPSCIVRRSRKRTKEKLLALRGGKCERCGYAKCARALSFHHLDPSQKDFSIARASNNAFEKVKLETEKCVLLCSNCHAEEHERLDLVTLT